MDTARTHFIWHKKLETWYRDGANGYTDEITEAGAFTEEESFRWASESKFLEPILMEEVYGREIEKAEAARRELDRRVELLQERANRRVLRHVCPRCRGTGQVNFGGCNLSGPDEKASCPRCQGTGHWYPPDLTRATNIANACTWYATESFFPHEELPDLDLTWVTLEEMIEAFRLRSVKKVDNVTVIEMTVHERLMAALYTMFHWEGQRPPNLDPILVSPSKGAAVLVADLRDFKRKAVRNGN